MALYKALDIEKEGAIVVITLNRPEVGNAFDMNMGAELDHAVRQIGEDKETRALIITGSGRHFSTGIDLGMFTKSDRRAPEEPAKQEILPPEDDETPGKGTALAAAIRIRNMLKPVIAAVNGPAVGLGFSIALACDIIIASDRGKFSLAFVKRGVVPDTGGTFNLPRIVGMQKACELALTGDTIDASEAERIGLAGRVVPHDELMPAAKELAGRIAQNPPLAVGLTKSYLHQAILTTDMVDHMKQEVATVEKLMSTADFLEAAAAFIEKRPPVFKGE